ncbi:MAG: hypothetical protein OXM54_10615, partial [Acidimicrobiaceae bacterium]|nr:hypothetical protein [Acidimicrobiaceae bacterium]
MADQLIGPSLKLSRRRLAALLLAAGLADQLIGPSLKPRRRDGHRPVRRGFGRSIDRPFIEAAGRCCR